MEGISEDEIGARLFDLAGDQILSQPLNDWIPEGFGFVIASQMAEMTLSPTFFARTKSGRWKSIPLTAEPIFQTTLEVAQIAYHSDWTDAHDRIARRSATFNAVENLIIRGGSLEGATLSGPELIEIPAETYRNVLPFLRRLFW